MKKILCLLLFIFASIAADAQTVNARVVLAFDPNCSSFDSSTGDFTFCFTAYIYPTTGGKLTLDRVQAVTLAGDTQSSVLTKITTAAVNAALVYNYAVARTAVLVPQYVRGQ